MAGAAAVRRRFWIGGGNRGVACVAKSGEESVSAVLSEVTRFAALVALLLWIRIRGEGHIVRRASAVLPGQSQPLGTSESTC